jgi:putative hydrolase of the HAD superfamily
MVLRGVIFDLGGTLVEYKNPRQWEWPGLEAFGTYLAAQGHAAPGAEALLDVHMQQFARFFERLDAAPDANMTQDDVFRAMLETHDIDLPLGEWDAARDAYYQACLANAEATLGGVETLAALQAKGLKLAALSNTQWPAGVLDQMLDMHGLLRYLPVRVYSCEVGVWKPWPGVFREALHALDLSPGEAAYVGDSLEQDVAGAQGVGMRAVWFRRPWGASVDGAKPDATIEALSALPAVVEQWAHNE